MAFLTKKIRLFRKDQRGATAIEYGLIAALITLVILPALYAYRDSTDVMFNVIETEVDEAIAASKTPPEPSSE